ncbi:ATP-binding protein [Pseudomonas fluorescens]|uniref:ATP-binding protein n=1 Tax=Pseudomonas fluorescens TaxID=294 RepID=UPI001240B8BF|nr:ATP-binding protein [Pseudomonas fluorescens]VVM94308.1 Transposon Tn7 transposition protein TnsC [Pseudomonas fluorescens]
MNRSAQDFAKYEDSPILEFQGNPLIEALPPIISESDAASQISYFPPVVDGERQLDKSVRLHCIDRLRSVVQPLPIHLELESAFSSLLRSGYVGRNPMSTATVRHLHSLSTRGGSDGFRSTATTFSLVGLSGIGKSTALESILQLYPQTIVHQRYEGRSFVQTQITWLKLDCPFDGSLSGLCRAFFRAVDQAIGQDRYANSYRARNGLPDLIQRMEQVASTYFVGALLIDEIQHLRSARTGGKDNMLNFFVNLINSIGIPVVFIGTNSMISLFSDVLRNARRGCGLGVIEFQRFEKDDPVWRMLLDSLWEYQWCREISPLTDELFDVLYDLTQGVTDFLVKLLILGQRFAIQSGEERLTSSTFRRVSDTKMQILKPALSALRSRDPRQLRRFEDLLPIDDQLQGMMTLDANEVMDRLALLRSITPVPRMDTPSEKVSSTPKTKPAGVDSSRSSTKSALIAQDEDPLQKLREEGWLNTDVFEFSPQHRKV